jgi:hypothetical protein
MATAQIYSCFDFRLRSEIGLPELNAAAEDDERSVVDIRVVSVPEVLPGGGETVGGLQVASDAALLTVPQIGRYLVRDGREILVDPLPGAAERMVRLFLLGSGLGILCHQRGLLPLHANAIVAGGGAYAFAGHSGAGKSTLAAYFARAGYPVLCDDVCVINFDAAGVPAAWPGLPRLKLWGDASTAFGHDSTVLERAIEGMEKYHVPLSAPPEAKPVPFRRLYLLQRSEVAGNSGIVRLRGRRAMEAIMAQTYRGIYLETMGLKARHFLQCSALACRIEVYAATRSWGYDVFDREAGQLANHLLEVSAV